MRTKIIGLILVGLLLVSGACGSKAPKTALITVQLIGTEQVPYWRPSTATVAVGGSVTFKNTGIDTRSVISDQGLFNKSLSPGESFKYTFTKAGTFTFHDDPNIDTNTIIVQ